MPADAFIKMPLPQCGVCWITPLQTTADYTPIPGILLQKRSITIIAAPAQHSHTHARVKRQADPVCLQINFPNESALACFLLPVGIKNLGH